MSWISFCCDFCFVSGVDDNLIDFQPNILYVHRLHAHRIVPFKCPIEIDQAKSPANGLLSSYYQLNFKVFTAKTTLYRAFSISKNGTSNHTSSQRFIVQSQKIHF